MAERLKEVGDCGKGLGVSWRRDEVKPDRAAVRAKVLRLEASACSVKVQVALCLRNCGWDEGEHLVKGSYALHSDPHFRDEAG